LASWPNVPTRFLLCQDDRFFPAEFQRRVVQDRLGFAPDEMSGGHLPALAHPEELVQRLERYRAEVEP
jgi:pimeloyl-ACP methyl ester carboxylesterase